jgi:hypothetical protein
LVCPAPGEEAAIPSRTPTSRTGCRFNRWARAAGRDGNMEEKERKAKGPEVERERGEREENCSHGCAAVQSAFKSREQGVKALHNERTGILDLAPCNGRGAATLSIATTPPPSHKQKSWWHFISLLRTLHPDSTQL